MTLLNPFRKLILSRRNSIVIITSIVVAATAAAVRDKFEKYSQIGGIIGSSVSAAFLIILGIMNVFILFRLLKQLRTHLRVGDDHASNSYDGLELVGGGLFIGMMKKMFKLIDRYVACPYALFACRAYNAKQAVEDVSSRCVIWIRIRYLF